MRAGRRQLAVVLTVEPTRSKVPSALEPRALMAAMQRTARECFDLPLETKLRWDVGSADVGRGYRRLGVASTAYT